MLIARTRNARRQRKPGNGKPPKPNGKLDEGARPEFVDATAAILAAKDEIVAGLIVKAKEGSYLHAKFLFDFAGLVPGGEAAAAEYAHQASLAQLLLDQLCGEGISIPGYKPATGQTARESV